MAQTSVSDESLGENEFNINMYSRQNNYGPRQFERTVRQLDLEVEGSLKKTLKVIIWLELHVTVALTSYAPLLLQLRFITAPTEQVLEQTITPNGKIQGAVIGFTSRKGAVARCVVTRHISAQYAENVTELCERSNHPSPQYEYHTMKSQTDEFLEVATKQNRYTKESEHHGKNIYYIKYGMTNTA